MKVGKYGSLSFDTLIKLPYSKDKFVTLSRIVSVLSCHAIYLETHVVNIFSQNLECLQHIDNIIMIFQKNNLLKIGQGSKLMEAILHQNVREWPSPFHAQSRLAMTEQFMRALEHAQMMHENNVLLFNTIISLFDNPSVRANGHCLIEGVGISNSSELIAYIDRLAQERNLTQNKLGEVMFEVGTTLGSLNLFSELFGLSDGLNEGSEKQGISYRK